MAGYRPFADANENAENSVDRLGMAAHWFRWSLAPGSLRQGPNVVEVELLKAEPTATFERACVALCPLRPDSPQSFRVVR